MQQNRPMASPAPNRARARRFRLKVLEPNEGEVLKAVLSALLYHPLVAEAYRMNTGAGRLLLPNGKISRFLHFGKCGSPDIHGYLKDGRALFVEVKSASGTVSEEQSAWIENAKKHGCAAFVARSVDDVVRELAVSTSTS